MTRSFIALLVPITLLCACSPRRDHTLAIADEPPGPADSFRGARAGDERVMGGVTLCWCPAGRFRMGSPRGAPERRHDHIGFRVVAVRQEETYFRTY